MSAIDIYLEDLFLYDFDQILDENFSLWLKEISPKKLVKTIENFVKKKDAKAFSIFLKTVPKTDFKKIYTQAVTFDNNFDERFKSVKKNLGSKVKFLSGRTLDAASFVLAVSISNESNIKEESKKVVSQFVNKLNKAGVKNIAAEGTVALVGLILGGILIASAFAILSSGPMFFALAVIAISLVIMMR